jgi:flagellar biogenesis protein FliO
LGALKFVGQVVAVALLVLAVGWGLMRIASWSSASREAADAVTIAATATASGANECACQTNLP